MCIKIKYPHSQKAIFTHWSNDWEQPRTKKISFTNYFTTTTHKQLTNIRLLVYFSLYLINISQFVNLKYHQNLLLNVSEHNFGILQIAMLLK